MKLHLTKGLLVALMAAAAQTMAADVYVNQTGSGAGSSGNWSIGSGFDASSTDTTASASFANGDSLTVNAAVGLTMKQDTELTNLTVNNLFNLNSTSYTLTVTGDLAVNAAFNVKSDLTLGTGSVTTGTGGSINVSSGATLNLSNRLNASDLTVSSTGEDSYSNGSNGFKTSGTAYSTSGLLGSATLSLSSGSVVAIDDVTYLVSDNDTMNAADLTTYYVNEGTVSSSSLGAVTNVQVAAGATLEFSGNTDHNTYNITLQGDDTSVATMALGGYYQCTEGTITLGGNATVTGSGDWGIIGNGGDIVAEGTNNTISSVLSIRKVDQNIEVKENGELTINSVNYNQYGDNHAEGDEIAELNKTGKGTLILAENATVNSNVVINLNEGALDLSNVTTLDASVLNIADGTTVIIGNTPVTLTGTLTLGDNITFDLSDWCTLDKFQTLGNGVSLFQYAEDSTKVFDSAYDRKEITLLFSDGSYTGALDLVTVDGKQTLMAIPEPTTATLSLLALAGLAARRRRK